MPLNVAQLHPVPYTCLQVSHRFLHIVALIEICTESIVLWLFLSAFVEELLKITITTSAVISATISAIIIHIAWLVPFDSIIFYPDGMRMVLKTIVIDLSRIKNRKYIKTRRIINASTHFIKDSIGTLKPFFIIRLCASIFK